MRNANEIPQSQRPETRTTFVVPTPLIQRFREIAKSKDQTLSQELRRLVREYVEQEAA
jgi:hypothetical protein